MEVHHHSHNPKKWREYITEFFMLFLAVSLGFIAENIREDQVIKHQTNKVMSQLYEELKLDTTEINDITLTHSRFDTATSFISFYLHQKNIEKYKYELYILNNFNSYRSGLFETNCLAFDQLKSTGLLKNVTDDSLRNYIEMYNFSINNMASRTAREVTFMDNHIDEFRASLFGFYKPFSKELEGLNVEKGKVITNATIKCKNIEMHLTQLIGTFVPDKLSFRKFNSQKYLDILYELNNIRNSTQERPLKLTKQRAIKLIKRIELIYPSVLNKKE